MLRGSTFPTRAFKRMSYNRRPQTIARVLLMSLCIHSTRGYPQKTLAGSQQAGNDGITPIHHPLWCPVTGIPLPVHSQHRDSSSFPTYRPSLRKSADPPQIRAMRGIEGVLKEVLGDDSLEDFSAPLMDMGLDSLAAVEFRNRVQARNPEGNGETKTGGDEVGKAMGRGRSAQNSRSVFLRDPHVWGRSA